MSIDNVLASVAVTDLATATDWYTRLLGKPPDAKPMPEVAEWQFARGGWLQVYQAPERAGQGSFTLAVSSLDEILPQVQKLGVDMSDRTSGPQVKTLMITDPDGNHVAIAEARDPQMAR
jgi:predicted enzyme related to lactoylglutathione lyase